MVWILEWTRNCKRRTRNRCSNNTISRIQKTWNTNGNKWWNKWQHSSRSQKKKLNNWERNSKLKMKKSWVLRRRGQRIDRKWNVSKMSGKWIDRKFKIKRKRFRNYKKKLKPGQPSSTLSTIWWQTSKSRNSLPSTLSIFSVKWLLTFN